MIQLKKVATFQKWELQRFSEFQRFVDVAPQLRSCINIIKMLYFQLSQPRMFETILTLNYLIWILLVFDIVFLSKLIQTLDANALVLFSQRFMIVFLITISKIVFFSSLSWIIYPREQRYRQKKFITRMNLIIKTSRIISDKIRSTKTTSLDNALT